MGYTKRILIGLDQLGNALAGGNPDCTISGRTGYFLENSPNWYWVSLAFVIDLTFYPFDGKNHCLQAYYSEKDELFLNPNSIFLFSVLSLITLASCFIMMPIFWLIYLIKLALK